MKKVKRYSFTLLFLLLISSAGMGQSVGAISEQEDSVRLKQHIERYFKLVKTHLLYAKDNRPNFDSAFYYLAKLLPLTRVSKNPDDYHKALILNARAYLKMDKFEEPKKLLAIAPDDEARAEICLYIALQYNAPIKNSFMDTPMYRADSALTYAYKGLAFSRKLNDSFLILDSTVGLFAYCQGYSRLGVHEKTIQALDDFFQINREKRDWSRARFYSGYGTCYLRAGNYTKAITYFILAEKSVDGDDMLPPEEKWVVQANNTVSLAMLYSWTEDSEKCVETLMPFIRKLNDPAEELNGWSHMQMLCTNLRKLNRVSESLELIEEIATLHPPQNAADSLYYNSSVAEAYLVLKREDLAEKYARRYLSNGKKNSNSHYRDACRLLANIFIRKGNAVAAQPYLDSLRKNLARKKNKEHQWVYNIASRIDSLKGDFKSSLANRIKSYQILDSIYNNNKFTAYRNLDIEFQSEKIKSKLLVKEKDYVLLQQRARLLDQQNELAAQDAALSQLRIDQATLLTSKNTTDLKLKNQKIDLLRQEATLQATRLEEQSFIRTIIVAGSALLAIVIALLLRQYFLKKKSSALVSGKNVLLEQSVKEKNWLLKEMHHRVKNNLQTIVSLLESQSAFLKNSQALSAIQDSQNRVNAMSLIHQKLYQSENMAYIDMGHYLPELVNYLKESFDTHQKIQFKTDVDSIDFDISQAIPVGLIINEAITNSIKYAFSPISVNPEINVTLKQEGDSIKLIVQDNGHGLPEDFDSSKIRQGLGLNLIRGLSQDIDGNFTMHSDNGVIIEVIFTVTKAQPESTVTRELALA